MPRTLCILHANCQGDALRPLLEASPEFSRLFEIRQYVNYKRQDVADADLAACGLFLHQYLAPAWGSYSTDQLLERLPAGSLAICLPNFFFKGYWPFWSNHFQEIEFADSMLESLLARGLKTEEILHLYLKGAPALFGDVERVALDSISHERKKESHTPIKYVHIIEERWRWEQLFLTVNHPGNALLLHMAESVLALLDLPPLPGSVLSGYVHPQGDFWLPIHPAIGKILGLPFAGKDRLYPCFAQTLTHKEYVSCYLACRKNGISDLTGVLKGLSGAVHA